MIGSLEYFQEPSLLKRLGRIVFGIPFFHAHRVWKELRSVDFHSGESILDLGCGDGIFGNQLADLYQASIYGVDRLAHRVKTANRTKDFYKRRCRYRVADLEKLDFLDEEIRFDTMLILDVLEHLKVPERVLRYALRTLRHGGKVIVQTPNRPQRRYLFRNLPERFAYGEDNHVREGFSLGELDDLFTHRLGLRRKTIQGLYNRPMGALWELSEYLRWGHPRFHALCLPVFLTCIAMTRDRIDLRDTSSQAASNNLFAVYEKL